MSAVRTLTDGQRRALEMIAHAPKTTTGKAYVGKCTVAFDHLVRINANAVRSLERIGLVETWLDSWGGHVPKYASTCVGLTDAGRSALSRLAAISSPDGKEKTHG